MLKKESLPETSLSSKLSVAKIARKHEKEHSGRLLYKILVVNNLQPSLKSSLESRRLQLKSDSFF